MKNIRGVFRNIGAQPATPCTSKIYGFRGVLMSQRVLSPTWKGKNKFSSPLEIFLNTPLKNISDNHVLTFVTASSKTT